MEKIESLFTQMLYDDKEAIYRLAYSYVKNEQDALDVVSESILKGYGSLKKVRELKYIKTWFYRIVINESNKLLKKRKRLFVASDEIEQVISKEADNEMLMDLYKSLGQLSEKYRTVIVLKYIKDMKIDDIARTLKTNSNTVKSRLKRGLDAMRNNLGGSYNEE